MLLRQHSQSRDVQRLPPIRGAVATRWLRLVLTVLGVRSIKLCRNEFRRGAVTAKTYSAESA